jgi:integrase/recombinase XerC
MAPFSVYSDFILYLENERRLSEHTVLAYRNDILQFIDFQELKAEEDFRDINHQNLRSWIVHLIDIGVSNRSVNRKLSSLRTFFQWLLKNKVIEKNPVIKIQGPKSEKKLPEFASSTEMNSVKWEGVFPNSESGFMDKLLIEVLYQTGIRLNELINLRIDNCSASHIKVLGKRNKERIVPISSELYQMIAIQMKSSKSLDSVFLFHLPNGNKLYPKFVYRKINYYLGIVTSLDKKSPHVLRHSFATHMLNNGAGLEVLKELLGHANLTATQIYTHNSFTELTNIYSQTHPRGFKKDKL